MEHAPIGPREAAAAATAAAATAATAAAPRALTTSNFGGVGILRTSRLLDFCSLAGTGKLHYRPPSPSRCNSQQSLTRVTSFKPAPKIAKLRISGVSGDSAGVERWASELAPLEPRHASERGFPRRRCSGLGRARSVQYERPASRVELLHETPCSPLYRRVPYVERHTATYPNGALSDPPAPDW